jgi:hypothetical protein
MSGVWLPLLEMGSSLCGLPLMISMSTVRLLRTNVLAVLVIKGKHIILQIMVILFIEDGTNFQKILSHHIILFAAFRTLF